MFSLNSGSVSGKATLKTLLEGKDLHILLSAAAQRALAMRTTPLIAEMEIYFSCLIRLRVRFYEDDILSTATPVTEQLSIRFRPVVSTCCDLHEVKGKPPLVDLPIVKRTAFMPHWLRLDYRKGQWMGEFDYKDLDASKS